MSSLAAKLRKLKQAYYHETSVIDMPDGSQWVLSTLSAEDDRGMADYLLPYFSNSYGHYVKLETLARAVRWVRTSDGDVIDLRNVQYIETGEVNGANIPVKVPRHEFMRDIINSLTDMVVDILFTKWSEMITDLESGIHKSAKLELADSPLLVKIDTVEAELRSLVTQAENRGLKINSDLSRYFGISPLKDGGGDALLQALQSRGLSNTPSEDDEGVYVHPADEQLAQEMREEPGIYRGVPKTPAPTMEEEVPLPVRK